MKSKLLSFAVFIATMFCISTSALAATRMTLQEGDGDEVGTASNPLKVSLTGGGSGAPDDATYITQTANGDLSAEQALSSLSTGIMRVATTTGAVTSLTDSAGIAANISDESGTGVMAFTTSPTFTTPILGAASATTLDTGNGAYELFKMDQDVDVAATPTFGGLTLTAPLAVTQGGTGSVTEQGGLNTLINGGSDGQFLKKVSGNWEPASFSGLANIVEDTTPQLGGMLDVNTFSIGDGTRKLLDFVEDGSAVNYWEIENQATGSGPIFRAKGSDTNVDAVFEAQGNGSHRFTNTTGTASAYTAGCTNCDNQIRPDGTGNVTVSDGTDNTKQISFEVSGATTAKKMTVSSSHTDNRTLTIPDATTTMVGTDTTQTLTAKTIGAGALTLAENASIALDPAGSADGKYSGITITATSGYTQAFGDLVYLDPTDSRWEAVDANAAAAADGDARGILGIVVSTGTDGNACTILLHGVVRADANFPALTINAPVYASETAGDIVVTQPTTAAVVVRIVGQAITADEIYFNPSPEWGEV